MYRLERAYKAAAKSAKVDFGSNGEGVVVDFATMRHTRVRKPGSNGERASEDQDRPVRRQEAFDAHQDGSTAGVAPLPARYPQYIYVS